MYKLISPQKSTYKIELEKGQKCAFCTCGRSNKQSYSSGPHKEGATFKLNVFLAKKSGTAFLCGCKMTGNPPYYDDTYNTI